MLSMVDEGGGGGGSHTLKFYRMVSGVDDKNKYQEVSY